MQAAEARPKSHIDDLRARLLLVGLTVSGFAKKHGFKPKTVERVIARHWDQPTSPRGKSRIIIEELKDEISGVIISDAQH